MRGFKASKADTVATDAKRAIDEGHAIFVLQLRAGITMSASITRQVPGFAEVMESVEDLGWVLDKSTFIIHNNNPTAYLIYRRAA
jgi:hypothetical protein